MDDSRDKRRQVSGFKGKDEASCLYDTEHEEMPEDHNENKRGIRKEGKSRTMDKQLAAARIVEECYTTGYFEKLLSAITDDYEHHSFWVMEPMRGKETVTPYYIGKGKTLRRSGGKIGSEIVRISEKPRAVHFDNMVVNGKAVRNSRVVIWSDLGKACVLMEQETDGETVRVLAIPTVNGEGKITKLFITDPLLYDLVPLSD